MKANAPKRKVFADAMDLLTDTIEQVKGVASIAIDAIVPFHDHPFHLYEGERLQDMVESIKVHGILNPVIVRKIERGYEMLAGHNRLNAAKIAGLTEVPAIVKENMSDENAYVYVIETNLMQRSFTDLQPSEKVAVLPQICRTAHTLHQARHDSWKGGHRVHLLCHPPVPLIRL